MMVASVADEARINLVRLYIYVYVELCSQMPQKHIILLSAKVE